MLGIYLVTLSAFFAIFALNRCLTILWYRRFFPGQ